MRLILKFISGGIIPIPLEIIFFKSGKDNPSSIINPQLIKTGFAPITARSFIVPETANLPILPPGEKIGFTT